MAYVFLLLSLPLLALPVLVYGDAFLADYEDMQRRNAVALADAAIVEGVKRVKLTPTYSGQFTKLILQPPGKVVVRVTHTSPTTVHMLGVAYPLGHPIAVARGEAEFETTDGNVTWHLKGGKQFKVGVRHYEALPINRHTGGP